MELINQRIDESVKQWAIQIWNSREMSGLAMEIWEGSTCRDVECHGIGGGYPEECVELGTRRGPRALEGQMEKGEQTKSMKGSIPEGRGKTSLVSRTMRRHCFKKEEGGDLN